ncbi:patatin-like phospholipase family protein [Congregibacter brevis]|uniref:Patatin-like phospholipase family protein n=1 Tax=Congregibacter brevis TaxID=3081201 RepID=A0ABZ0IDW9_9GAMM|nr:patatin-like phospholipase family protein [Congregibacter sp. IMCC45268]
MKNALILSGGGARAAYQVGVLKAIAQLLPDGAKNPFPVICGTSAGAINAVTLAAHDGSFADAINELEAVWMRLTPEQVYRSGWGAMASSGGRLILSLVNRGVGVGNPVALLDNSPLRELIKHTINFEKIDRAIARGDIDAVCVTATGYESGRSMCFYQAGSGVSDWSRYRRSGRRTLLNTDHLMASSAIPTMFPATRIEYEYFGDGAVRQLAPLSPALHLGADRLFIVGVSANREKPQNDPVPRSAHSPSLAQIVGHLLNSAFIDSLESDIERLDRINNLLASLPTEAQSSTSKLRYIERQVISPSEELDVIAAQNIDSLHPSVRFLLRTTGGTESGAGSTAASYLLFAKPFVESLIALGYRDAMWQKNDIASFLSVPLAD